MVNYITLRESSSIEPTLSLEKGEADIYINAEGGSKL